MKLLLRYVGTVLAVALTISTMPGISVEGMHGISGGPTGPWLTILIVALVWSVITMVIRPILKLLTLPITIITFGLFSLVLNALLFWLVSALIPEFHISGFWSAFFGAIVLSILSWLIHKALSPLEHS
jgi:putative membrane protein